MNVDPANLAAILAMAVATWSTRIGGLWLIQFVQLTPRTRAALDALPVAVLTAVIAPSLAKGGLPDICAAAVTLIAATRLPLLPVVVIGVASAVLFRSMMV